MADTTVGRPMTGDAPLPSRWISVVAHFILLGGAAAAVFIAGRTLPGRLGVFLVAAGLALMACPPQFRVDRKLAAVGAAVLATASMALLPASWFSGHGWRQALVSAGVALPASVTPLREVTVFWLAVFALAALVGLFALGHPLRSRQQLALCLVGVVICATYAGLAIYAHVTGWAYPFDHDPRVFGFFWNINHTSTFLVTGCLLSLAVLGIAYRGRHWIAGPLAAVGLAVCGSAVFFFSTSRGGILALFFGVVLWFCGLGAVNRSRALVVSFAAVFLASVLLFLASESTARHRLLRLVGLDGTRGAAAITPVQPAADPAKAGATPARDFRLLIYADTFRIIRDFPLTGTGLGTFQSVFPFYRERALSDALVLHPESDWLTVAAEAGLPTVVLLAAGLGLLISGAWRRRDHPFWPLRWGILCAGMAALFHGFVDVPAHNPPLGLWILVILGIGSQFRPRASAVRPSRWEHGLFVAAGLGALALGIPLVRAEWFGGTFWPPEVGAVAARKIDVLQGEGKFAEAVEAAREAVRRAPLEGLLYTQLGAALLEQNAPHAEVEAAFRAGRQVIPNMPGVAVEQGLYWIDTDPAKTAALWQEGLRRRERIDLHSKVGDQGVLSFYANLLRLADTYPELQRQLLVANAERPEFVLLWLERAAPALISGEIPRLAADGDFLDSLAEPGRRRFLAAWYDHGDREALLRWIKGRPEWQNAAWPIDVRRLVDARNFQEVTQKIAERYAIDLTLPPVGSRAGEEWAEERLGVVEAFHAVWHKGNTVAARRMLEEGRADPTASAEVWRLSAAVAASEGDWPAAWRHLEGYLKKSGLGSFP